MSGKAGAAAVSVGKVKAPPTPAQGKKGAAAAPSGKGKAVTVDEDGATTAAPLLTSPPPPLTPFDLLPEVWALPSLSAQRRSSSSQPPSASAAGAVLPLANSRAGLCDALSHPLPRACVRSRLCALLGLVDGPSGVPSLQRVEVDEAVLHLRFACSLQLSGPQIHLVYRIIHAIHQQLTAAQPLSNPALIDRVRLLLTSHCTERIAGTQPLDCSALLPTLTFPPLPQPPLPSPPPSATPPTSRPTTAAKKAHAASAPARPTAAASPRPTSASAKARPQSKAAQAEAAAAAAAAEAAAISETQALAVEAAGPPPPPPPPPHFLTPAQLSWVYGHLHERMLQHLDLYRAAWSRGSGGADVGEVVADLHRPPLPSAWLLPLDGATEEEGAQSDEAQAEESEHCRGGAEVEDALELQLSPAVADLASEECIHVLAVKAELEERLRAARAEAKAAAATAPAATAAVR